MSIFHPNGCLHKYCTVLTKCLNIADIALKDSNVAPLRVESPKMKRKKILSSNYCTGDGVTRLLTSMFCFKNSIWAPCEQAKTVSWTFSYTESAKWALCQRSQGLHRHRVRVVNNWHWHFVNVVGDYADTDSGLLLTTWTSGFVNIYAKFHKFAPKVLLVHKGPG